MVLTGRRRRALAAICDTFVPGAAACGVPESIAATLEHNPRRAEHRQLELLLDMFAAIRFDRRAPARREATLRAWADSRLARRRGAYEALRRAVLVSAYSTPGAAQEAIGFPGPLPHRPSPSSTETTGLSPVRLAREAELTCDVVVVGSGAGGGTAAAVLARAGLDVIVLEAGEHRDDRDLGGDDLAGVRSLYLNGGALATDDGTLAIASGRCLGGGTVVNYTTSFPTPPAVREEWGGAFATEEYERSLDAVQARLGVTDARSALSARDGVLERGCRALGWHVAPVVRNVGPECDEGAECGRCGFGCRRGAKRSTAKTWLADAAGAGARLVVGVHADRVVVRDGAARGVEATAAGGHRVVVRARAVVAAAGALHTPALLRRSGLSNPNVGRHLHLHPQTAVFGVFDEEVRAWEGVLQGRYSQQLADLDGAGHGARLVTAPLTPLVLGGLIPWPGQRLHAELAGAYPRLGLVAIIQRDRDAGEVRVDRRGHPIVRYRLSPADRRHQRAAVQGAAQVVAAAGARRVLSAHSRLVDDTPDLRRFMARADAAGWAPGRLAMSSFHQMGSARHGSSPRTSACDPDGEAWDVRGLVVADASAFPSASGVNPMISVEATAHMTARALAARIPPA